MDGQNIAMECGKSNRSDAGLDDSRPVSATTTQPQYSEIPDFRVDFSGWECASEPQAGLSYLSLVPIDYFGAGYEFSTTTEDYSGKIKKPRRSRLFSRRGAVVLQNSPLGKGSHLVKKLHIAVNSSDYTAVCKFLEDGVDPSAADDKHRTPLHIASAKGAQEIVQVLLRHGANPNTKDVIGNTPLHLAVCSNQIGTITMLLKGGANAHALDRNGRTPLHLAHSRLTRTTDYNYNSQQLRMEVTEIIAMLKMYIHSIGFGGEIDKLNELGDKLEETTTKKGVDEIQEMLVGFTHMTIEKQCKVKDTS
ncbi:ankyrin repeat domain-containing protein 54-like [Saccoglossus kowalevskii]|uniref:Ankyrin repeat domain-containing protein 54-like n=1 Tax=Saccoglossus kowalevskii TaxID=10224 RepID=A0ABM0GL20_SACKO|nr:PREDICTED: ankyrin repeat domain-containing protein 54-like [Saccoglossus kowalevskii]